MEFDRSGRALWPITDADARVLAGEVGLVYDDLPEWISFPEAKEVLGLRTCVQIRGAARAGRLPGAESIPMRPAKPEGRRFWRLPRNGLVFYAYNRRTGPQPPGGLPHLKPARPAFQELRRARGRKRKEVTV